MGMHSSENMEVDIFLSLHLELTTLNSHIILPSCGSRGDHRKFNVLAQKFAGNECNETSS